MVLRIFKMLTNSGVLATLECKKIRFWSVAPPAGGAYGVPQTL